MRPAEVAAGLSRLGLGARRRAGSQRVEHVLDDVLRGQALDQLGLLQAHRRLVRHGVQQLAVLRRELAPPRDAGQDPELLVAGHERRHQQGVCVEAGPEGALHSAVAASVGPSHQVENERRPARTQARRRGVRRIGAGQAQLVAVGVEAVDPAGVGVQQLPQAARDRVVEVLAQRDRGERLAQPGERGERLDPAAGPLVELGVLDRAAHQRRRVHQEVEHVVVELPRRLGVQHHHADHVAGLGQDGHGHHRLKALLLELRHVAHARVLERVLADEGGRLRAGHPAGEPLVQAPAELPHQALVAAGRRPQREAARLHEVDEAGVAAGRVGGDVHDAPQHAVQVQRGRDRLDDGVQRLVLAPRPLEGVCGADGRGNRHGGHIVASGPNGPMCGPHVRSAQTEWLPSIARAPLRP